MKKLKCHCGSKEFKLVNVCKSCNSTTERGLDLSKELKKLRHPKCKNFSLTCYDCVLNESIEVVLLEVKHLEWVKKEVEKAKKIGEVKELNKIMKKLCKEK